MAAIRHPDQLAGAIIDGLHIKESGAEQPMQHLIRYLQPKKILLVLDNFEQLLVDDEKDPSPNNEKSAASLLAELLSECPTLHLLVTSRERLHLRAEHRLRVPPLALMAALEDVRAALAWAIAQGEVEVGLRFLWPLRCFWGNWRGEDHTLRYWARASFVKLNFN